MNKLCIGAGQIVGNQQYSPPREIYPQWFTAASQAVPLSNRMQLTVAPVFSDLSRISGHIISCYYSLKI
jgi:hypothetical protein